VAGACALLAVGTYLFINWQITGNPFTFLIYQKEHWFQRFGFFGDTIRMIFSNMERRRFHEVMPLWLSEAVFIVIALWACAYACRRVKLSHAAYLVISVFVALSPTWLLSFPRYLSACASVYFVFAIAFNSKKKWAAFVFVSLLLMGFLLFHYATGRQLM
jgi:hypothetical protein